MPRCRVRCVCSPKRDLRSCCRSTISRRIAARRNYCHLADAWGGRDISAFLYPQAEHIHYAVLNRRDYAVLTRAGVPAERLHYLPNPLGTNGCRPDRNRARQQLCERFGIPTTDRFLLYPVRAIRRKNIGEALLWAVLGGPAVHVGMTLAPLNPAEQPYYRRWKQVAREMRLQVHFEIGGARGLPLDENLASADLTLTTSVTEGFGMAFLESWVAERALVGRDLPEITADFAASGLQLEDLYRQAQDPDRLDRPERVPRHAADCIPRDAGVVPQAHPQCSTNRPAWWPSEAGTMSSTSLIWTSTPREGAARGARRSAAA